MNLPGPGGIQDFMIDETGDAQGVVWTLSEKVDGQKHEYDVNTSVLTKFSAYQSRALSLSAVELRGCTMLAIVSRKAVYISHWWESISFNTDQADLDAEETTQEQLFQETILKPLKDGYRTKGQTIQVSLRLNADALDDDHIRAYLIHPSTHSKEDTSDMQTGYREYWDRIKEAVLEYLPRLKEPNRWNDIPYDVVPDELEHELDSTARGRMLFKYDHNHVNENGRVMQRTLIWSETNEIHRDEWPQ